MASTDLRFSGRAEHRAWLGTQATLPDGFRIGTTRFTFTPVELPRPARMTITLLALERPTPAFAARFTRNAFPGAPVILGRRRLSAPVLGALVVNNKVSNVCAPDGVEAAERVCAAAARTLGFDPEEVLPASTGVIGWRLPVEEMVAALPAAASALESRSALAGAEAILTTDLYPKVRRAAVGEGSIVGFAKGAGMIEPNLATMLVFLLTDLDVSRERLRSALEAAVEESFNRISVDSDTSTSDSVFLLSSRRRPPPPPGAFEVGLARVCSDLAEDVVRNGEGVRHVVRAAVTGAPDRRAALLVARAVVNSPLFKAAVSGNDPNVGRLLCAVGKVAGAEGLTLDPLRAVMRLGGETVLEGGTMRLDPQKEGRLVSHLRAAELYASAPPVEGVFKPPVDFPSHERCVEIAIDLGLGGGAATVLGADLTHEYVSENADYRS
ncbi:MAG TPA: bifunctional ornithine acetyltransferase/N-acetylglutamate synthase [Anaeromyxobacter sp.]|nr:bifunctional ornithine acetyltransferase/N-acetylglutamate synthase [Anaeromyxobacter sp.]